MQPLKKISRDAVDRALERAERYRFLNEPAEAESICLDILSVDSENQKALVILLLAKTDQLSGGYSVGELDLTQILNRLKGDYERSYYQGIIFERQAKTKLHERRPGSEQMALELLRQAMEHYEKAEKLHPAGNEDAILRWNTCARIIERNKLQQTADHGREAAEYPLE